MKKNKTVMRVVSKILFVCLAINTLPVSFPVHAKTLTPQKRTALRREIDRDIKQVKTTVNKLNFAKNAVPVAIGLAGTAITIVIAVLAGMLIWVVRKRLIIDFENKITKLRDMLRKSQDVSPKLESLKTFFSWKNPEFNMFLHALYDLHSTLDRLSNKQKVLKMSPTKLLNELKKLKIDVHIIWPRIQEMVVLKAPKLKDLATKFPKALNIDIFLEKETLTLKKLGPLFKNKKKINSFLTGLTNRITLASSTQIDTQLQALNPENLLSQLSTMQNRKSNLSFWMGMATPIISVFMLLFGFLGSIGTAILVRLPFSKGSINKTTKLVRKLEGFEKEFPGILTSEQRVVLAKFKKLAGDLKIQAILQNMELKAKLTTLASGVIQQNKALTKELGGTENAQKTLEKYFSRRLRKALLKRNLDKADAKLKALGIKLFYNRAKSKVASMEKKYPMLQSATKDAVQEYMREANKTLEKFNELLADAIVEGKITPKVKLGPIIPL